MGCVPGTVAVLLLGLFAVPTGAAPLAEGTILGPTTAADATGLLPEEIEARYQHGEFAHAIALPRPETQWTDPAFERAAATNRGRYAVDEHGTIVDQATGRPPGPIFGPPFPDVDPADPAAGVKLVWNFFYQSYLLGDDHNLVTLSWVSRRGLDRRVATDVWQKYYDGQGPRGPASNPQGLLFQQLSTTTFPADLQGTVALAWRYRDARRDSTWAYVPALRRVRAVSPTNRSDGFLGSDISQDDGVYFDGKPEDFTWKYLGERDMLCLYDRGAIVDGEHDIRPLPGGGWRIVYPAKPRFAWQAGDGRLLPWAPLSERTVLVRRPVHVVEAVPRDPYYLYGRLVLRLEKGTYVGCYNSKSDWQGQVLNTFTPLRGAWFRASADGPWRPYAAAQLALSQNFKLDRATAVLPSSDDPSTPSDSLIPLDAALFDYQAMVQKGR
jgi:uncharacterized protein DUF1329